MAFPGTRMRRLRSSAAIRDLVRETDLAPRHLIQPMFVVPGEGVRTEIEGLPGIHRLSIAELVEEAGAVREAGVNSILLFGSGTAKDESGSEAFDDEGVVQMALRALKDAHPDLLVVTDVCLCAYTDHGHCGFVRDGRVDNDITIELLAKVAISHAGAGADIVAPSDMMDGRVGAIRGQLDEEGQAEVGLMSYSAKFASAFYGPFRNAAGSAPEDGDRRGYQMDPANLDQALREVELDIEEGADIVMVKPAAGYLDVIAAVAARVDVPVAAYHVSGEYAMLKAAAATGALEERPAVLETLTGIRRAGAGAIITYYAAQAAAWLS